MKYKISYGCGFATLYTPYPPVDRFYTLANTCFGIRKSILFCSVIGKEDIECDDFERLEFNGDIYIWDSEGRRKMLKPYKDDEWDDYYCEGCKYTGS